jgi:hypothetical protein
MTSNTRYNNGKIYKIINNFNDMVYIGSTCLPLRKRIFNHKKEQRAGRSPNRHLFQLVSEAVNGWDDFQIVLIESYPCANKDELFRYEEHHRAQFVAVTPELCLNMCRAYATHADKLLQKKESRQRNTTTHTDYMRSYAHRPHVKAYRQQYEKDNADRRKARARELYSYQCTWGGDKAYHNNMLSIEPALFT